MCKSCRRLCRAYLRPLRAPRLYLLQHAHSTRVVHVAHSAHAAHTAHTKHTAHTAHTAHAAHIAQHTRSTHKHMCTRIAAVRPCGRKTQLELRVGQYLTSIIAQTLCSDGGEVQECGRYFQNSVGYEECEIIEEG
jgi:hypothetical protein